MLTTTHIFKVDSFQFECFYFSGGNQFLIAFNGYGEDASRLAILMPFVGEQYSLLSINLPFHGASAPQEANTTLDPETLENLLKQLQQHFGFHRFALFGYSLGGKIALRIYQSLPRLTTKLYLFAPDGIVLNRWYNLAMHFSISRKLFKGIIAQPNAFLTLVRFLGKSGIINQRLSKFVLLHMEQREQRQMVYDVWYCHRKILPDIPLIKKQMTEHQTSVQLFFGRRDLVIQPRIGRQFKNGLGDHCELHLLDAGHLLIQEKYLRFMK